MCYNFKMLQKYLSENLSSSNVGTPLSPPREMSRENEIQALSRVQMLCRTTFVLCVICCIMTFDAAPEHNSNSQTRREQREK